MLSTTKSHTMFVLVTVEPAVTGLEAVIAAVVVSVNEIVILDSSVSCVTTKLAMRVSLS